jgi:pilus assembly protein CpaB
MNKRFVGVLTFAFMVALGASLVLYRVLVNRPASAAQTATVQIALAGRDLELGTVLKEADIKLTAWSGPVPLGATKRVEDLVGRGVITPMYANEPIVDSRMAPRGAGGGLAAMIPPGKRAVAIRVNEVVGVAGFVVAGMRVDVLISGAPPGGTSSQGTLTRTLLQNLEVLSAGQDLKKDAEGKPMAVQVVNMLVTPEEAEQLSLAASQTSIQLVLRNPLDHVISKTPGTALLALFGGPKINLPQAAAAPARVERRAAAPRPVAVVAHVVPPAPKKEVPVTMEIISGSKKAEIKFESTEGK